MKSACANRPCPWIPYILKKLVTCSSSRCDMKMNHANSNSWLKHSGQSRSAWRTCCTPQYKWAWCTVQGDKPILGLQIIAKMSLNQQISILVIKGNFAFAENILSSDLTWAMVIHITTLNAFTKLADAGWSWLWSTKVLQLHNFMLPLPWTLISLQGSHLMWLFAPMVSYKTVAWTYNKVSRVPSCAIMNYSTIVTMICCLTAQIPCDAKLQKMWSPVIDPCSNGIPIYSLRVTWSMTHLLVTGGYHLVPFANLKASLLTMHSDRGVPFLGLGKYANPPAPILK